MLIISLHIGIGATIGFLACALLTAGRCNTCEYVDRCRELENKLNHNRGEFMESHILGRDNLGEFGSNALS